MSFASELSHLVETGVGSGLRAFAEEFDAQWVSDALERGGAVSVRKRKLPAESVVWLVVGMALFRDHSIADVLRRLELVEPGRGGERRTVVDGAIPRARERVGEGPLRELFSISASRWSHGHAGGERWRGLSVYALDGTTLSVPDTDDNREAFKLPGSGRGQAGYPKVRVVALIAARSHRVVAAELGAFSGKGTAEPKLAQPLWDRVPDQALLIADRNFIDYAQLYRFHAAATERHGLVRMKSNLVSKTVVSLGDGDELAEVDIGRHVRRHDQSLPTTMKVRIVHYRHDGQPQRLMTSLLDPQRWPAEEIVAMYHERREIEIAFDELKTHMLDRREAVRSKSPPSVRQEIRGLLLAYNLVRYRMVLAAEKQAMQARETSFVFSLRLVRAFLLVTAWEASPGTVPKHLERLDQDLESARLPARRSQRRYDRHVKVKMSGYRRNPGRPRKALESLGEPPK